MSTVVELDGVRFIPHQLLGNALQRPPTPTVSAPLTPFSTSSSPVLGGLGFRNLQFFFYSWLIEIPMLMKFFAIFPTMYYFNLEVPSWRTMLMKFLYFFICSFEYCIKRRSVKFFTILQCQFYTCSFRPNETCTCGQMKMRKRYIYRWIKCNNFTMQILFLILKTNIFQTNINCQH